MEWVRRGAAVLGGPIARLLYPPVCAGCRGAIARSNALCPNCWKELRFIERPFCEVLGLPFSFDLGRGFLSAEAIADPPVFARLRAAVLYQDLAAKLVSALKYGDRTDLVPLMSAWMVRAGREVLSDAELVVPVPLHAGRLFRRRFNQSAELGRAVAKTARLPFAPSMLRRVRPTRSQVGLGPEERRRNVRGAFQVKLGRVDEIRGKRVLLIDDVYTTGATVSAATRALKRAGASEVDVLVFARVAAGAE